MQRLAANNVSSRTRLTIRTDRPREKPRWIRLPNAVNISRMSFRVQCINRGVFQKRPRGQQDAPDTDPLHRACPRSLPSCNTQKSVRQFQTIFFAKFLCCCVCVSNLHRIPRAEGSTNFSCPNHSIASMIPWHSLQYCGSMPRIGDRQTGWFSGCSCTPHQSASETLRTTHQRSRAVFCACFLHNGGAPLRLGGI